jgi:hypothetical protein
LFIGLAAVQEIAIVVDGTAAKTTTHMQQSDNQTEENARDVGAIFFAVIFA